MHPTSRIGGYEGTLMTDIPTAVVQKLGLNPGDELVWMDDGAGGYRVMPLDEKREMLLIHEEVIGEYREVFDALSKS